MMLKPTPTRGGGRNPVLCNEIDRLYSQSPMARPLVQSGHNTSLDSSIHSAYSANSSVLQKLKPSVQLDDAFDDETGVRNKPRMQGNCGDTNDVVGRMTETRSNTSYGDNTEISDDQFEDDGSVLLDKDTTHEILGALDTHDKRDSFDNGDEVPRIAPAICLTPKFLASRKVGAPGNRLDCNGNVPNRLSDLRTRLDTVDESREVGDDDETDKGSHRSDSEITEETSDVEKEEEILVSQPVQKTKHKEYSLKEWTIKPVPSHRCILVEGLINNLGEEVLWRSTAIVKALDKRTLQTGSGSVYKLIGCMEIECAQKYGFSEAMCSAFKSGFPNNWQQLVERHFSGGEDGQTVSGAQKSKKGKKIKKGGAKKAKEAAKKQKKSNPEICMTPKAIEPLDLSTCERTRSGRVVVPSRSVAWWKGVRIYSTPHRPMEIRVDTPVENQLDSPLAWPLSVDKKKGQSVFTPPTGLPKQKRVRSRTGDFTEKVEQSESRDEDAKKVTKTQKGDGNGRERGCRRKKDVTESGSDDEGTKTVNETQAKRADSGDTNQSRSNRTNRRGDHFRKKKSEEESECDKINIGVKQDGKSGQFVSEKLRSGSLRVTRRGNSRSGSREGRLQENPSEHHEDPVVKPQRLRSRSIDNEVESATVVRPRRGRRNPDRSVSEDDNHRAPVRTDSGAERRVTRSRAQRSDNSKTTAEPLLSESDSQQSDSHVPRRRRKPRKTNSAAQKSNKKSEIGQKVVEEGDSDTDDEILCARNRLQEKKEITNRSGNSSGLGLNRSLKRMRGRTNSSLSVSVAGADGRDETTTWSDEEVQRFSKALKQISPEVDGYWTKIAEIVETKNDEECRAFHLRDVPRSLKKPKVVQKPVPQPKIVRDEDSIRIELSGGKGTFKRKRQMQTFLDAMNEDYDNDFFNSTPWLNNKRRKVTIPDDIMNDPVTPLPRVGMVNTPKTQAALQPFEEGKTPVSNFLSPDTLNNAYNEKDDLYIHRCGRLFRGRANSKQIRKATPKHKTQNLDAEKDGRMIMELCHNEASHENVRDDDEEEDEYFSDAEVQ